MDEPMRFLLPDDLSNAVSLYFEGNQAYEGGPLYKFNFNNNTITYDDDGMIIGEITVYDGSQVQKWVNDSYRQLILFDSFESIVIDGVSSDVDGLLTWLENVGAVEIAQPELTGRTFKFIDDPSSRLSGMSFSYYGSDSLFQSNGESFCRYVDDFSSMLYCDYDDEQTEVYNSENSPAWVDDEYKTITFTADPDFVSREFYQQDKVSLLNWLTNVTVEIVPYLTDSIELTSIADAIRSKGGTSSSLSFPAGFVSAIKDIPSGEAEEEIIARTISGAYENSRVTSIGIYAFYSCSNLTTASFPACTSIGSSAFYSCKNLTTVSFPACTSIGIYAFYGCRSLTTASFPECTSIGNYAFYSCKNLTTACFPECTSIGSGVFYSCISLTTASFPACENILSDAFLRCYNLTSLYLNGSSVVNLAYSNAFGSTPIAGYTTSTGGIFGSIYVLSSLLTSYKTATNWSYFSDRFVGI